MIQAYFCESGPLDELSRLYLLDLANAGEQVVLHAPEKTSPFTHHPMALFDDQGMGLSLRAAWYRRQHLSTEPKADEALVLLGYTSVALVPDSWLGGDKVIHIATRVPQTLPGAIKHAYVKRSVGFRIVTPTNEIKKRLVSWGVDVDRIDVREPNMAAHVEKHQHNHMPITTPGFLVAVVAPLALNQGLETVIQAIQLSTDIMPDLKVFIIGDGPDKKRFIWLLGQTHLKDRVHIAAHAADYQRFLQHVEICIAPATVDEGCDPIVLQARARGVAIIATDTPSHTELIQHGKTGLLYTPGNAHMLSQHLVNLYTHQDWLQHYKNSPQ